MTLELALRVSFSGVQVQYIAGGATQNSIRVAQWMLGEEGLTGFLGSIGADDYGSKLSSCAKADGVDTHYYIDPKVPTGTCAVLIKSGERSLVANLSAANNFDPTHLSTGKAQAMMESSRITYIAGFFLTVSVEAILNIAERSVKHSKVRRVPSPGRCRSTQRAACAVHNS